MSHKLVQRHEFAAKILTVGTIECLYWRALALCDSPLEITFLWHMWQRGFTPSGVITDGFGRTAEGTMVRKGPRRWSDFDLISERKSSGWNFDQQALVGDYRLDFSFCKSGTSPKLLVDVELDGHAFHEKTREQAQHDKTRDRFLTLQGWKVLRYTYEDILHNCERCIDEVLSVA